MAQTNAQTTQIDSKPKAKKNWFSAVPYIIRHLGLRSIEREFYELILEYCGNRTYCYLDIESFAKELNCCERTVINCSKSLSNPQLLLDGKSLVNIQNGVIWLSDIWEENQNFMENRRHKNGTQVPEFWNVSSKKWNGRSKKWNAGSIPAQVKPPYIDNIDMNRTTILTIDDQSVVVPLHTENSDQPQPLEFLQLAKALESHLSSEPIEPTSTLPSNPANIASEEENSAMQHNIQNQTGPTLPCEGTSPTIISKIAANNAGIANEFDYLAPKASKATKLTQNPIKTKRGLDDASNSYLKAPKPIKTTREGEMEYESKINSQEQIKTILEGFDRLPEGRRLEDSTKRNLISEFTQEVISNATLCLERESEIRKSADGFIYSACKYKYKVPPIPVIPQNNREFAIEKIVKIAGKPGVNDQYDDQHKEMRLSDGSAIRAASEYIEFTQACVGTKSSRQILYTEKDFKNQCAQAMKEFNFKIRNNITK